jgi:hypothetical protein
MDLREKEEDQGVIIVNISGPIEASKGEVMKMMKPTRVCITPGTMREVTAMDIEDMKRIRIMTKKILIQITDRGRKLKDLGTREKLEKGAIREQSVDVCQLLPRQTRETPNQRGSRPSQTNLMDLPRWRLFWSNFRLAPSIIAGMRRTS